MDISWNMAVQNQSAKARKFADKWAGRGYEKGDTGSFWLELLAEVVGMADVSTNVRFEHRTSARGFVDVTIPDAKTFIEQKPLHVDLDKPEERQGRLVTPFEQAKAYADSMPNSQRPRHHHRLQLRDLQNPQSRERGSGERIRRIPAFRAARADPPARLSDRPAERQAQARREGLAGRGRADRAPLRDAA